MNKSSPSNGEWIDVSIIIVQYKVKEILFKCIDSITSSVSNLSYEIIIVDNDDIKTIEFDLRKRYSKVKYIPNENRGFGNGNNVGAKLAKGNFIFFLNPDTSIFKATIKPLIRFIEKNPKVGIVAPVLLHPDMKPIELQGLAPLTPLRGIFALSFINKIWPKNPISRGYWGTDSDKSLVREVGTIPGTAFMMRRELYERVGGFDENYFLYFEEMDLCKRILELGYQIYMIPQAKVIHLWGKSTEQRPDIDRIFKESRFYYFKKHYGILAAMLVESFTRVNKNFAIFFLITTTFIILTIYGFFENMIFIGDQGWFYLSARDLLMGRSFPLVGITSSHTWLHQGPLWTYLLSIALWLGNYNPLAGGFLSVGISLGTLFLVYLLGKKLFSDRIGMIAALLYATSPLVIIHSRMPYHTTPIPLITLLYFYSLTAWIKGHEVFFSAIFILLAALYNFELASVILFFHFILVLLYGFTKRRPWVTHLKKRDWSLSVFGVAIIMLPVTIYDFQHGFKQTIVYGIWLVLQPVKALLGLFQHNTISRSSDFFHQSSELLKRLLFLPNALIAFIVLLGAIIIPLILLYKQFQRRRVHTELFLLLLWFAVAAVIFLVNHTASEAYTPLFYISILYLLAISLDFLLQRWLKLTLVSLMVFVLLNVSSLLKHNYFMKGSDGISYQDRIQAVRTVGIEANHQPYQLVGKGQGSQFESFLAPYEYLGWYLGYPYTTKVSNNVFSIEERGGEVIITKIP